MAMKNELAINANYNTFNHLCAHEREEVYFFVSLLLSIALSLDVILWTNILFAKLFLTLPALGSATSCVRGGYTMRSQPPNNPNTTLLSVKHSYFLFFYSLIFLVCLPNVVLKGSK